MYLDYQIRERFSGNIQSQPAHVYARTLQIMPGVSLDADRLGKKLEQRGYREVTDITRPGEFRKTDSVLDAFVRANEYGVANSQPRAVRVIFDRGRVASMTSHSNGQKIDQLEIEPLMIGTLQLGSFKDRIYLKLHEIPEFLIKAVLAMEDQNFETHVGIDPKAISRAFLFNLKQGKTVQGGSTLTQQLVKNLFLTPQRTITRKATEAVMAVLVEMRYSKAEILELYLNEIFLGQAGNRAVHGFGLASEHYFGKPLDQLDPPEMAMMVGIIPGPSFYNPHRHPERALKRRDLVLRTLVDIGVLTEEKANTYKSYPAGVVKPQYGSSGSYPAYIDYLHRQLRQFYSEEVLRFSGLKLLTSLDIEVQDAAQSGLTQTLSEIEQQRGMESGSLQGAVVVVSQRNGEILALVGDRIKGYSGFNRAVDAERPIGSLVKPAVYLTALEKPGDFSLATLLDDNPLTLAPKGGEPWSPQNYDKEFRGQVPLYEGLVFSYNLPTVNLGLSVGIDQVVDTLHRLGISRDIEEFPSTLLGASTHSPLEVAQMYQTLANEGARIPLRSIKSILDNRGQSVARFPLYPEQVADRESVYLVDFSLRQAVLRGTGAGLQRSFGSDYGLAGKTGTTDGYRDSWFAGYNDELLAVVWVGRGR